MSKSNDPGHYFQSTAQLESASRKAVKAKNNTAGAPIKLSSKVLALIPDPTDLEHRNVFVAEATGVVRYVRIAGLNGEAGEVDKKKIYRGPMAPLTTLTLSPDATTIFAGCWDKTIWSWSIATCQQQRRFTGHTDFVKAVVCARLSSAHGDKEILLSGSADACIIAWDVQAGTSLLKVRDAGRILDMAVDVSSFTYSSPGAAVVPDSFVLYTASSDPQVRRWQVEGTKTEVSVKVTELSLPEVLAHETSVNALFFSPHYFPFPASRGAVFDSEAQDQDERVLYTASSDNTARAYVVAHPAAVDGNETGDGITHWKQSLALVHPDFVRAVAVDADAGLIVTACRDEDVRVYDLHDQGRLVHTWRGHFEEVTTLALVGGRLVSGSIDGTVRTWSLGRGEMESARVRGEQEGEFVGDSNGKDGKGEDEEVEIVMTEEEEKELAELMESDDD